MHSRDIVSLVVGAAIGVVGILGTLLGAPEVGIVALLALGVLILGVLVLQRRQLARIQQRTLSILNSRPPATTQDKQIQLDPDNTRRDMAISTKKVVGLLQAQQAGLDTLNAKVEQALSQENP